MNRHLSFILGILLIASTANAAEFGSDTDTKWTATSANGCTAGSTITLDGLKVTLGNTNWTWHDGNKGLIPEQSPSTDGTVSTLVTTFSEKSPYGTLPTKGCYLVLNPSKSGFVSITGIDGSDNSYALAEVKSGKVVSATVTPKGFTASYYVEASKTYYFIPLAKEGQLSSWRYTLQSITVNPTDLLTNPDFSSTTMTNNAPDGWTLTQKPYTSKISTVEKGGGFIKATQPHWQIWDGDYNNTGYTAKAYQTVKGLPLGVYTVGVTLVPDFAGGRVKLYGNNNSAAITSGKYEQYTVDAAVTDGTLTLGLDIATTGTTDIEIDDYTLTYKQPLSNDYNGQVFLSELDTEAPAAVSNVNVTLGRKLTAGQWNTFSVPFAINDISVLGTVKEVKSAPANTITFDDAQTIEAGKAYVVKPSETVVNPLFKNVNVVSVTNPETADGNSQFLPQIYRHSLPVDGTVAYLTASGEVKKLTSGTISGLRGYIKLASASANVKAFFLNEETTGINSIDSDNALDNAVYDLCGRRMPSATNLPKGIYIVNGKKVITK